jgi:hypothetical protein
MEESYSHQLRSLSESLKEVSDLEQNCPKNWKINFVSYSWTNSINEHNTGAFSLEINFFVWIYFSNVLSYNEHLQQFRNFKSFNDFTLDGIPLVFHGHIYY